MRMSKTRVTLLLVLLVLAVIVVLQNTGDVSIRFLWITATMPKLALLLLTLALGVALGLLAALVPGGKHGDGGRPGQSPGDGEG